MSTLLRLSDSVQKTPRFRLQELMTLSSAVKSKQTVPPKGWHTTHEKIGDDGCEEQGSCGYGYISLLSILMTLQYRIVLFNTLSR